MCVPDEQLGAEQAKAAARLARRQSDAGRIPAQIGLGPGQRRLGLAFGYLRQPMAALLRLGAIASRR